MTEYKITLPAPLDFKEAVEFLNQYGEVTKVSLPTGHLEWTVEADSPFELGVALVEQFDEAEANEYFQYGILNPLELQITPDPRF